MKSRFLPRARRSVHSGGANGSSMPIRFADTRPGGPAERSPGREPGVELIRTIKPRRGDRKSLLNGRILPPLRGCRSFLTATHGSRRGLLSASPPALPAAVLSTNRIGMGSSRKPATALHDASRGSEARFRGWCYGAGQSFPGAGTFSVQTSWPAGRLKSGKPSGSW